MRSAFWLVFLKAHGLTALSFRGRPSCVKIHVEELRSRLSAAFERVGASPSHAD